jgi:glutamate transport system substrate-binding protein
MRLTRLTIPALAIAAALAVTGCTDSGATDDSTAPAVDDTISFDAGTTMAELNEAQAITIGTKFDQPLFGQVDANGDPQGFDVEIGKLIAAKLGIPADKITWTETVSSNREPFIQSGEVNLVVATYTINDKRKEVVSFAGPYYNAGQDILVLAGNPEGITGPEDLAGKAVCTVTGSTSEANLAEYTDNIVSLAGYADCLEPLRAGTVAAVSTDNVILAGLADAAAGEFEVVGNPFTEEPYGIGVALDDDEFRAFINDVIDEALEDGTWDSLWEKTAGTVLPLPKHPTVDRY